MVPAAKAQLPTLRQTILLAFMVLFVLTAVCRAASYRWTDRDGTLHFSDSPPTAEVPLKNLDPTDPEQRPLLGKPLTVYRDDVFTLVLTKEEEDLLQFDLTYDNIHRTYPETVSDPVRLQLCATTAERFYTYLAYTVLPVTGGSGTVQLTNRLSKQSPASLETGSLQLSLYTYGNDRSKYRSLFTREIPFAKLWLKRKGVVYQ